MPRATSASTDCVAPAPTDFIDSGVAKLAFLTVDNFVCPLPEQLEVTVNVVDGVSFTHWSHSALP